MTLTLLMKDESLKVLLSGSVMAAMRLRSDWRAVIRVGERRRGVSGRATWAPWGPSERCRWAAGGLGRGDESGDKSRRARGRARAFPRLAPRSAYCTPPRAAHV